MSRIDSQAVEALLVIAAGLGFLVAFLADKGWVFLASFGLLLAAIWIDIGRDRRDR